MKPSLKIAILASTTLIVSHAFASKVLTAYPNELSLNSGASKTGYLTVVNEGSNKAYIVLTPTRVDNAGTKNAKVIKEKNPKKLGLLVSPTKLILKPGKQRKVKITDLVKGNDKDVIFKINGAQFNMPSKKTGKDLSDETGVTAEVAIGFTTYVYARPISLKPDINININGDKATFTNTGNTTVNVNSIRQCDANDSCLNVSPLWLFPNASRERSLPMKNTPIHYTIAYLGKNIEKTAS